MDSISSAPGCVLVVVVGDVIDDRFVVVVVGVVVGFDVIVGSARVDLDPDIERFGRLAVASAHQLEVADEAADRRGGQALGAGLVTDLVLERRDVGDQVGLATGIDRVDGEAARRRGQQVVATVRDSAPPRGSRPAPRHRRARASGRDRPRGPRGSGRPRTAPRCRGSGGSARGSDPRRCGAAGRCPDRGPCAAGRAGSASAFPSRFGMRRMARAASEPGV